MPVLIFLMLQYESFHTVFSAPESMEKRLKNCIRGKIPKVDAVRDLLSRIDPKEIEKIHAQTIDVIKRNRVFREGTIGGYVVAGIDGVELFSSTKKSCPECLSRKNGSGKTEYDDCSVLYSWRLHEERRTTTSPETRIRSFGASGCSSRHKNSCTIRRPSHFVST